LDIDRRPFRLHERFSDTDRRPLGVRGFSRDTQRRPFFKSEIAWTPIGGRFSNRGIAWRANGGRFFLRDLARRPNGGQSGSQKSHGLKKAADLSLENRTESERRPFLPSSSWPGDRTAAVSSPSEDAFRLTDAGFVEEWTR